MSGKRLLLDTNIIIRLFGNDTGIINKVKEGNDLFIPSIVIGELFYGAEQSQRRKENIRKVELFSKLCSVFVCDMKTAKFYGVIKSNLKAKGAPIPENDIWICRISHAT